MSWLQRYFKWLDQRRDIKLQRQILLATSLQNTQQASVLAALAALSNHTDLMKTWFQGFQSVSQGQPYSSVMREEDELLAEQLREQAKKNGNTEGMVPLPNPWEMEAQIAGLMFKEDSE